MNVVVDHVTKTIHGAVVLQDISLNFESGKVYGLQGENGSGKTMLLRLMCGLIYGLPIQRRHTPLEKSFLLRRIL